MIDPPRIDVRRDGAAIGLLIVAALAIQLPIYNRWISLLDESAILQIADQLNDGGMLYRDAVHVAFPGIFYLTAGLFRLFGPSMLVGRYFMVIAFTLMVILVYLLARTVAGRAPALCVALLAVAYRVWAFPHWQMLSYTSVAVLLLTFAVLILAIGIRRPHPAWTLLAGFVVGVAAVFKQDCSAFAAVGLAGFLFTDGFGSRPFRSSAYRAVRFGATAAVPPAVAVLAFTAAGLGGEMLWQTLWFPLVRQPVWAPTLGDGFQYIGFPPLWPPLAQSRAIRWDGFFSYFPSLVLDFSYLTILRSRLYQDTILPEVFVRTVYVLPYAVLALLIGREGVRSWRRRRSATASPPAMHVRSLWLLLFFGVAMIASFSRPRDLIHLMILYLPTVILLAVLAEILAGPSGGWRRRFVLALFGGLVIVVLAVSFHVASLARRFYDTPLMSPRAGVRVNEDAAVALNPLIETLAKRPGVPLASLPYEPALNFLADRPLATRFFALLPLEEFPDRQEQMIADLARDPRTQIVYSLQLLASIPRPQEYAPKLFRALVNRYSLGKMFNGTRMDGWLFSLLRPRPKTDERILFDFAEHLPEATVREVGGYGGISRVEDGDGRFGLEIWPFERPVVSLRPMVQPAKTQLAFSVDVPQPARLRFGVAMNPDEWSRFLTSALHFVVRADDRVLFNVTLDPSRDFDDRRWEFADIPVSAGRKTFVFETSSDNEFGVVDNLAGFAHPRLIADLPREGMQNSEAGG